MTTKLERKRTELNLEIERLEAELVTVAAEVDVERGVVAASEALGEIDHERAASDRRKLEERVTGLRERLGALREALPVIDQRIVVEAEARRREEVATTRRELASRIGERRRAEAAVRKALITAERAASELMGQRERVDEAVAAVQVVIAEEDGAAWPEDGDETWDADGLNSLRVLLEEGPHAPNAKIAADAARAAETRKKQSYELLRWFRNWPNDERLKELPEHLHAEARAIQAEYDEKRAEQESRRGEREVDRVTSRV